MGSMKHIAILLLIVVFLAIVLAALRPATRLEPFVTKAKDCTCEPGFVPQKCGDAIHTHVEKWNKCGGVQKNSYYCLSGSGQTAFCS